MGKLGEGTRRKRRNKEREEKEINKEKVRKQEDGWEHEKRKEMELYSEVIEERGELQRRRSFNAKKQTLYLL